MLDGKECTVISDNETGMIWTDLYNDRFDFSTILGTALKPYCEKYGFEEVLCSKLKKDISYRLISHDNPKNPGSDVLIDTTVLLINVLPAGSDLKDPQVVFSDYSAEYGVPEFDLFFCNENKNTFDSRILGDFLKDYGTIPNGRYNVVNISAEDMDFLKNGGILLPESKMRETETLEYYADSKGMSCNYFGYNDYIYNGLIVNWVSEHRAYVGDSISEIITESFPCPVFFDGTTLYYNKPAAEEYRSPSIRFIDLPDIKKIVTEYDRGGIHEGPYILEFTRTASGVLTLKNPSEKATEGYYLKYGDQTIIFETE